MFPHPLSWWSCESEISLTQKMTERGILYIFIYVSNVYMLNFTIIQRREPKCINPLECINLVLGDRMNLWLGYIRLIL